MNEYTERLLEVTIDNLVEFYSLGEVKNLYDLIKALRSKADELENEIKGAGVDLKENFTISFNVPLKTLDNLEFVTKMIKKYKIAKLLLENLSLLLYFSECKLIFLEVGSHDA